MELIKNIIIILLFILTACKTHKKTNLEIYKKEYTMEIFDIKKYEQIKTENKDFFIKDDSTIVKLSESIDSYQQTEVSAKSPFALKKIFNKKTRSLKKTGQFFYNFPIGIHKEYNERGILVNEINHEEYFKFSIEDLIKKMEKEFGLNIMDTHNKIEISRSINPSPHYHITYPSYKNFDGVVNIVIIDGTTGEIKANIKKERKE